MAAGQGFKTFTTGEVLTAADVNGYLMQGVLVFASEAARDAAITSPQEGQFAYTKDNNSLWYYTGSAWAASGATGDIEGVTAGVGISGGGTSGTVTITNSMATAITTAGDLIKGTGSGTFDRLGIGTTGQVLTVSGGAPAWTTLASSSPTMYEERFTSSGTWTVPSGVNNVWVMMIAGGGGGSGGGSYWGEPGKHGSVLNQQLAVTPSASVSYTIGAGGAGGAATSGGDYGSATSFGSLSASGGLPGTQSLWPNSDVTRSLGSYATPINGAPVLGTNDANGNAGTANTGGGGSGGKGASKSGGAGGSGFIIIRYVK